MHGVFVEARLMGGKNKKRPIASEKFIRTAFSDKRPFSMSKLMSVLYPFLVISLIIFLFYWSFRPATAQISGSLTSTDGVKTQYNSPIENNISPCCG